MIGVHMGNYSQISHFKESNKTFGSTIWGFINLENNLNDVETISLMIDQQTFMHSITRLFCPYDLLLVITLREDEKSRFYEQHMKSS